jgi:hypothetical protein
MHGAVERNTDNHECLPFLVKNIKKDAMHRTKETSASINDVEESFGRNVSRSRSANNTAINDILA